MFNVPTTSVARLMVATETGLLDGQFFPLLRENANCGRVLGLLLKHNLNLRFLESSSYLITIKLVKPCHQLVEAFHQCPRLTFR